MDGSVFGRKCSASSELVKNVCSAGLSACEKELYSRPSNQALIKLDLHSKQAIGKLRIGKDEVLTGIADLRLRVLPYTADHALHLFDLPLHHSDPFDRQIIRMPLV